jgi:hypothetical protein
MPVDFDAVEVVNGMSAFNLPGDRRIEEGVRDLHTMIENGHLVAAVGNSDTHHLSSVLAGVPRNYVFVDDGRLDPFDVDGFVAALRARRVLVTTAPWLEVRAGGAGTGGLALAPGGRLPVEIRLRQASWSRATRVRVWVGRELRHTFAVDGTSFTWSGELDVGAVDAWIGVDASGDEPLPHELHSLWLEKPPMPPFAMINPILVDVDGNGRWDRARAKPSSFPDVPAPPPGLRAPAECSPGWPLPERTL